MASLTNFTYDPVAQGYSTTFWRSVTGTPTVSGGLLRFNNQAAQAYGSILKGDVSFVVTVPTAPTASDDREFGLVAASAHIKFDITGAVFRVQISDGKGNTENRTITWQAAWTNTPTRFRIKWEAGRVEFWVGPTKQATISEDSVPDAPLSLLVRNVNADNMDVTVIEAVGLQSYLV